MAVLGRGIPDLHFAHRTVALSQTHEAIWLSQRFFHFQRKGEAQQSVLPCLQHQSAPLCTGGSQHPGLWSPLTWWGDPAGTPCSLSLRLGKESSPPWQMLCYKNDEFKSTCSLWLKKNPSDQQNFSPSACKGRFSLKAKLPCGYKIEAGLVRTDLTFFNCLCIFNHVHHLKRSGAGSW